MTEQAVFNLIPFAGAWWEMAQMERQASFIGEFLQFEFPEPIAVAIAAATIGGNQQMFTTTILGLSQLLPPTSNRFNGKLCGIMVNPHVHPRLILAQVIDAIGNRFALGFIGKIVGFDRRRLSLGLPFLPTIFELTDVFLLFGINRDHGTMLVLKRFDLLSNVLKLGIAIRMLLPFLGLAIALQTVAQVYQ